MKGTLQKSLDHVHNMTCLGSRYPMRERDALIIRLIFDQRIFAAVFSFDWRFVNWSPLIFLYLCSVIGSAWATAVKELMEHYVEREAQYPVLKHVVLENLRKIKTEKIDEYNKVEILFSRSDDLLFFNANRYCSTMKRLSKKWSILNGEWWKPNVLMMMLTNVHDRKKVESNDSIRKFYLE